MNFQSLRTKFLELLHPSASGRVDLRLENVNEEDQVLLVIDKELYAVGTLPQATQCVEHVLQSAAPDYWKNAVHLIHEKIHVLDAEHNWEKSPEVMIARMASAIGWVDRRIGNRTIEKEQVGNGEVHSEVERRLKAIRQGFPAPEVQKAAVHA